MMGVEEQRVAQITWWVIKLARDVRYSVRRGCTEVIKHIKVNAVVIVDVSVRWTTVCVAVKPVGVGRVSNLCAA